MSELELIARVVLAAVLGAALGFERESRRKAAGLRTHALVSMGAALFTVTGGYGFDDTGAFVAADPTRAAAQVATGIGFVGAGAILRTGATVRGLTTAATLWVAAALGVSAGAGLYLVSAGALAAVFVIVVGLGLAKPAIYRHQRLVAVHYEQGHGTLGPVLNTLEEIAGEVRGIHLDDDAATGLRLAEVQVRAIDDQSLDEVIDIIAARPEVHRAEWRVGTRRRSDDGGAAP